MGGRVANQGRDTGKHPLRKIIKNIYKIVLINSFNSTIVTTWTAQGRPATGDREMKAKITHSDIREQFKRTAHQVRMYNEYCASTRSKYIRFFQWEVVAYEAALLALAQIKPNA